MNNLKFRAWDKANKEMLKIDVIDFFLKGIRVLEHNGNSFFMKFSDVEIMQSTGLKDKNEKEIFEGDIVRGVFLENHEVVWREIRGCWLIQPLRTIGFIDLAKFNRKLEVIGNIYENRELLENDR